MLIVSLDQYIVVVALPDIGRDLGYSSQTLQSVVSAYAIASSGFLLLGGRASDVVGRRGVLLAGLSLYLLGSVAGGLANSIVQQLAGRVVQGLGGALVFPSTLALINVLFREGAERNRAVAVWAGAGAAGLVIGVLLGGALTSAFGWRAVFLVNVPMAGCALVAALGLIGGDATAKRGRSFDAPGAFAVTSSVLLIVLALVEGPSFGWSSPVTWGMLLAGAALSVVFVAVENRSRDPLLPMVMLRNGWLILASCVAFLFMATFGALLYFLSIYLQDVRGYNALQTGLTFLLPTTVVVIASTVAGGVATRVGLRATMMVALSIGAIGALAIGLAISSNAAFPVLAPGLIAVSVGDGVTFTAIFIAASTGVPDQQQGVASGIVSTAMGVGAAIGLALLVLVAEFGRNTRVEEALQAADIGRVAYAIAFGVVLTLLLVVARTPRTRFAAGAAR